MLYANFSLVKINNKTRRSAVVKEPPNIKVGELSHVEDSQYVF